MAYPTYKGTWSCSDPYVWAMWKKYFPQGIGREPLRIHYSKTKTSWHLWAEHEASSTMPNFHLRGVFFVMESNIAYSIESK